MSDPVKLSGGCAVWALAGLASFGLFLASAIHLATVVS